jgi:hypothetical protein
MGDLIRHERAALARMVGPAVHAGLEKSAVDDQLTPAVEQIEQAGLSLRPVKLVRLFNREPRHSPPLCCQRVARVSQVLLLDEKLLARGLPLLR